MPRRSSRGFCSGAPRTASAGSAGLEADLEDGEFLSDLGKLHQGRAVEVDQERVLRQPHDLAVEPLVERVRLLGLVRELLQPTYELVQRVELRVARSLGGEAKSGRLERATWTRAQPA